MAILGHSICSYLKCWCHYNMNHHHQCDQICQKPPHAHTMAKNSFHRQSLWISNCMPAALGLLKISQLNIQLLISKYLSLVDFSKSSHKLLIQDQYTYAHNYNWIWVPIIIVKGLNVIVNNVISHSLIFPFRMRTRGNNSALVKQNVFTSFVLSICIGNVIEIVKIGKKLGELL